MDLIRPERRGRHVAHPDGRVRCRARRGLGIDGDHHAAGAGEAPSGLGNCGQLCALSIWDAALLRTARAIVELEAGEGVALSRTEAGTVPGTRHGCSIRALSRRD